MSFNDFRDTFVRTVSSLDFSVDDDDDDNLTILGNLASVDVEDFQE
jgi:hypothetical protein